MNRVRTTKPSYRRATARDAAAIVTIATRVLEEVGPASGLSRPMTPDGVKERMDAYEDRGAMLLCRVSKKPVGFAALEPVPDEPDAAVLGVWVLPQHRGQGIGTDLALMAVDFARAKGYRKVRGTIPPGNEAALSFFSSIGALVPHVAGPDMRYELPL